MDPFYVPERSLPFLWLNFHHTLMASNLFLQSRPFFQAPGSYYSCILGYLEVPWHLKLHKSRFISAPHQTCPPLMDINGCTITRPTSKLESWIPLSIPLTFYSIQSPNVLYFSNNLTVSQSSSVFPPLPLPSSLLLGQDLILFCFYNFPDSTGPS